MSFTVNAFEMQGWPKSRWKNGQFHGERKLICDWDDRVQLLVELNMIENLVYPYPEGPSNALAYQADIDPQPGAQTSRPSPQTTAYEKAVITVRYRSNWGFLVGGDIIHERIEPTGDFHTVDYTKLYWDSSQAEQFTSGEAPGRIFYGYDYVKTFRNQVGVPSWVQSYTGFVNSNVVNAPMLQQSFEAETLLFKPPTLIDAVNFAGAPVWDIYTRLSWVPQGWNKFWYAKNQQYQVAYQSDGTEYKNHPSTVFDWA